MCRTTSIFLAILIVAGLFPNSFSQVGGTIPVGNGPMYLAVDEARNRIYVTNQFDDTVSVIDGGTNTVVATVTVGRIPNGIAVNPRTNRIYVANLGESSISIIDGTTFRTSTLTVGMTPSKVAVNPLTDRVYVTLEDENGSIAVIDGKLRHLISLVPLPPFPLSVAVDLPDNWIYVGDFLCGCGDVTVVDGATNAVISTIAVPGSLELDGVALDPRNHLVYVTDESSGFYVIDQTSGSVLGQLSSLSFPNEVAAVPGTDLAVEPDTGSNSAVIINVTNLSSWKIPVGNFPTGIAVNDVTRRVYVANHHDRTVSVIQLSAEGSP